MRLPSRRVYRAFPELDRFDDAACQRFAREAMRMSRGAWAGWIVGTGAVAIGAGIGVFVGGVLLVRPFIRASRLAPGDWTMLLALAVIVLAISTALLVPLAVRDWLLRRRIRRHIWSWRCRCGYLLLGLVPRDGALTCPECGEATALADRGTDEAGYRALVGAAGLGGGGGSGGGAGVVEQAAPVSL
jgi:hypothetical protein